MMPAGTARRAGCFTFSGRIRAASRPCSHSSEHFAPTMPRAAVSLACMGQRGGLETCWGEASRLDVTRASSPCERVWASSACSEGHWFSGGVRTGWKPVSRRSRLSRLANTFSVVVGGWPGHVLVLLLLAARSHGPEYMLACSEHHDRPGRTRGSAAYRCAGGWERACAGCVAPTLEQTNHTAVTLLCSPESGRRFTFGTDRPHQRRLPWGPT